MKAQQYWERELGHFAKAYEVNFNHFMGVFYFWIASMTFPATAGLLAKDTIMTPLMFSVLLFSLAVLGVFLAAKMYDIRCSQLKYTSYMNKARHYLYQDVKDELPKEYELPFDVKTDLRCIALTDFGMAMAVVMSLANACYAGCSVLVLDRHCWPKPLLTFFIFLLFGIGLYVGFVLKKVPPPQLGKNE